MTVAIVGAGLSGLFTASELLAAGIEDVVLVDRAEAPGGVTRTIEKHGFAIEPAAGSFNLPHPHLGPILDRAKVDVIEAVDSSIRYVYADGQMIEIPASPKALLTPLLPPLAKLRALAEPLVAQGPPAGDETLVAFLQRRFGERAGHLMAWLTASGVYAGDPALLSASSAFPNLTALEDASGSVIRGVLKRRRDSPSDTPRPRSHIPVGGMSALTDSIAASLGDRFRPGFQVDAVHHDSAQWTVQGTETIIADQVVLAVGTDVAAGLVDAELASHLREATSAPVVTVGICGLGSSPLPPGYGVLVTPDNEMVSRGLLFESSYAPSRAPDGSWLLKVIAGGMPHAQVVDWGDDRLTGVVIADVQQVLGSSISPTMVEIMRHRPGIPQYVQGHGSWLEYLEQLLRARSGLHVTGWGYRGVGVAHLATDAVRLAETIRS